MFLRLAAFGWAALLVGLLPGAAAAQHVAIAGPSGARALAGPHYLIGPSLGQRVGGNLFDSFTRFSLATGESATFTGPKAITNIIAGVTGGTRSTIDGKIKSEIRGANFYLINPSGVVIGPQGKVDVRGSFYASTADTLKLGRNGRFQVTHPGGSRLTAAPPSAFGFLKAKPAAITVDGSALGPVPGTFGLVGGPVTVRDRAKASADGVDVTAVAGKGAVPVDPRRRAAATVRHFGRAAITGGSQLLAGGGPGDGKAGLLSVTAGQLTLRDGAGLISIPLQRGGRPDPILVSARSILIDGGDSASLTEIGSMTIGRGTAASVTVSAGSLRIIRNGAISASTFVAGNGGSVAVHVRGRLVIANGADPSIATGITSEAFPGAGHSGSVTVTAGTLRIVDFGDISAGTFGSGNGGRVVVRVRGRLTIDNGRNSDVATGITSQAFAGSSGDSGSVEVEAGTLQIARFGDISASTSGSGAGGSVFVGVRGRLIIDNGRNPFVAAGITSQAFFGSTGDSGSVNVTAGSLQIIDNGVISAGTSGSGNGGNVSITVRGRLAIDGGKGGSGTGIDALAGKGSTGRAGDVSIAAGSVSLGHGGMIAAGTSGSGNGGDVAVTVAGRLTIRGSFFSAARTGITSQAFAGSTGNAGAVTVDAGRLQLIDYGEISARTFGPGKGGEVSVGAGRILLSGGEITAQTTGAGSGGDVSVSARGGLTMNVGVGPLPPEVPVGIFSSAGRGTGSAGNIIVSAGTLRILGGGEISVDTFRGKGGRISVAVRRRLTIEGNGAPILDAGIAAETSGTGNGGSIAVAAGSVLLSRGARISAGTSGPGNGGAVRVRAAGTLTIDGVGSFVFTGVSSEAFASDSGNAGTVAVTAGALRIANNGAIAAGTSGAGSGGEVTVAVAGRLTIDGAGANPQFLTGIASQTGSGSSGNAGTVTVAAGALRILSGAIAAGTFGSGSGGDIAVAVAGRLTIDGAASPQFLTGIASQTGSSGNGGNVAVNARSLSILDDGSISSSAVGAFGPFPASTGNAGSVVVDAGSISLATGGEISAATVGTGNGGPITVSVGGRLSITGKGQISASGISSQSFGGAGNGGDLRVAAGSLSIANGGQIASGTFGPGNGGSVFAAVAGRISIARGGKITAISGGGSGSGGSIFVSSTALTIASGGEIASETFGPGSGGNIAVSAADRMVIGGGGKAGSTGILATAAAGSTGTGGNVSIGGGRLAILDGGAISTERLGSGHTGSITVRDRELSIDGGSASGITGISARSEIGSSGNAGNVAIEAATLSIRAGQISASTRGKGTGGNVTVGIALRAGLTAGAQIAAGTTGPGAGGTVAVRVAGALALAGSGTGIAASASGRQSGAGGSVTVAAGSLTIAGGAEIASSTAGPGRGGDVGVRAGSDIRLFGPGSQITALSTGAGDAGMVAVAAANLLMNNGATISTQARTANGGDITVSVGNLLSLADAGITTSVLGAAGNGGNITIASGLTLLDGGTIKAQAKGGNGGNITIDKYGGTYVQSIDSTVSASSQKGISGVVEINGITPLNGALVALSSELRSAVALAASSCAALAGRPQSSLVAAGRGGLPQDPDATLPALYIAGRDLRLAPPAPPSRADTGGDLRSMLSAPARCG